MGTLKMLRVTDSVKDRLASYYHWQDRQGFQQALSICQETSQVDFEDLKQWSKNEGYLEQFYFFLEAVSKQKKTGA